MSQEHDSKHRSTDALLGTIAVAVVGLAIGVFVALQGLQPAIF